MHKTTYTRAQIKEAMETLAALKATEIKAKQNELKRLALLKAANRRSSIRSREDFVPTFDNCHGKSKYCPVCFPVRDLVVTNLSSTTARKSCELCKGSFEYTRSDTAEGRTQRAREWRAAKKEKK